MYKRNSYGCGCGLDADIREGRSGCGCGLDADIREGRNACGCNNGRREPRSGCGLDGNFREGRNACGCNNGRREPRSGCGCPNACDCEKLFMELTSVSFALDELRLYLDTHPCCTEALEQFCECQKKREALLAEYTENCCAIDSYFVNTNDGWNWISEPMPWKGGIR